MSLESFKISESLKKQFIEALKKCEDMVDLEGWRYSKMLGMDDYIPIDVDNIHIQYQYHVCMNFLKQFFSRSHDRETVFSEDLKTGAEVWFKHTEDKDISIHNGVMLVAIISKHLSPDDLWYSMETNQQALIQPRKWKDFCNQYNYKQKVDWEDLVDSSEDSDVVKIN